MQNNTFSTLFVGQNLIKLSAVDSTNNFLKSLLSKSEPLPEGTVIMADEQFAGRGQQGNVWHTEPGKNLTFSILLKPSFLPLTKQFLLNMAISVAINKALLKYLGNNVQIKWPNDIYYGDQKIGGMLIENTIVGSAIKSSVIGVGLNVNQEYFPAHLVNSATSLYQILQENVNLQLTLAEICSHIEVVYLQLKAGRDTVIKEEYVNNLYKINKRASYRQNGEVFEGMITGITDQGLLKIEKEGKLIEFNFKEIEFIHNTL
ncbi:MAG: biotin--[acetyl-CoA-carboxylase] ligase [Bacteroidota bacterium]